MSDAGAPLDGGGGVADGETLVDADASPPADAGFVFPGSWSSIGGLPPACNLRSDAVASDLPQLSWEPCPSGRTGCRRAVVDWASKAPKLTFPAIEPAQLVGGQTMLLYQRNYYSPAGKLQSYMTVLQRGDAAVFAVGQEIVNLGSCAANLGYGTFGVAANVLIGTPPSSTHALVTADWMHLSPLVAKTFALSDVGATSVGDVSNVSLGDTVAFLEVTDPATVATYDPMNSAFAKSSSSAPIGGPRAVGAGAYVLHGAPTSGVDYVAKNAGATAVVRPTSPHVVSAFAVDRSGGGALLWVESDESGGTYSNPIVWLTPYATSAGGVQARRLTVLADTLGLGGFGLVANAGVALVVTGKQTAQLVRLSDGASWKFMADPADAFVTAVWVDDTEVWLTIADVTSTHYQGQEAGIVRIRRDSLGAPGPAMLPRVPPGPPRKR